jgi:hypothetical protein
VYDDRREKGYNDKLKMPNFHLSEEEARLITMVVAGLTKDMVAQNRMAGDDPQSRLIEEGRKRVSQHNCRACHIVDRSGRAIASTDRRHELPPARSLARGIARAVAVPLQLPERSDTMKIRPWLSVRMPTFHFDDHEANTLVTFFAGEGRRSSSTPRASRIRRRRTSPSAAKSSTWCAAAQCHSTAPVNPESPPVPDVAERAVARAEPHAGARPPAPRVDPRLDPPSGRDDPVDAHAGQLPARRGHRRLPVAAGDGHRHAAVRAVQGVAAAVLPQ